MHKGKSHCIFQFAIPFVYFMQHIIFKLPVRSHYKYISNEHDLWKALQSSWHSNYSAITPHASGLGQAIGPLWDFCAPISIVVELQEWYQLFLTPQKITGSSFTIYYNYKNRCTEGPKILICTAYSRVVHLDFSKPSDLQQPFYL